MKLEFMKIASVGVLGICYALGMPLAKAAVIALPAPNYLVQYNVGSNPGVQYTGPTPQSGSGVQGSISAGGSATGIPNPTVTGYVTGGAQQGSTSGAAILTSIVQYYYAVVGPAGVSVPLILTASAALSATNVAGLSYQGVAELGLNGNSRIAAACVSDGNCTPFGPSLFSLSYGFNWLSNTQGSVTLDLQEQINNNPSPTARIGTISGYLDPIIVIDPAFAQAGQFSLVFSSGIGNSPNEIPETASLLIFLTSLGGFFAMRRFVNGCQGADVLAG